MEYKRLVYSPTEAAKKIDISRNTMYELIKKGVIPAIRVSEKRIIIPAEALEKWLNDPENFICAAKSRG